jgi:hypothetical protein
MGFRSRADLPRALRSHVSRCGGFTRLCPRTVSRLFVDDPNLAGDGAPSCAGAAGLSPAGGCDLG